MAQFLEKALDALSSARDYGVVLISGGAIYLADGAGNVVPNMDASAAGLGGAAVCLGLAKAYDAWRARTTEKKRKAVRASEEAAKLPERCKVLAMILEQQGFADEGKRLSHAAAMNSTGIMSIEELGTVFSTYAKLLSEAAPRLAEPRVVPRRPPGA